MLDQAAWFLQSAYGRRVGHLPQTKNYGLHGVSMYAEDNWVCQRQQVPSTGAEVHSLP